MLSNENRAKLDAIVAQLADQNAPEEDVKAIVDDFVAKYDEPEAVTPEAPPAPPAPKNTAETLFPATESAFKGIEQIPKDVGVLGTVQRVARVPLGVVQDLTSLPQRAVAAAIPTEQTRGTRGGEKKGAWEALGNEQGGLLAKQIQKANEDTTSSPLVKNLKTAALQLIPEAASNFGVTAAINQGSKLIRYWGARPAKVAYKEIMDKSVDVKDYLLSKMKASPRISVEEISESVQKDLDNSINAIVNTPGFQDKVVNMAEVIDATKSSIKKVSQLGNLKSTNQQLDDLLGEIGRLTDGNASLSGKDAMEIIFKNNPLRKANATNQELEAAAELEKNLLGKIFGDAEEAAEHLDYIETLKKVSAIKEVEIKNTRDIATKALELALRRSSTLGMGIDLAKGGYGGLKNTAVRTARVADATATKAMDRYALPSLRGSFLNRVLKTPEEEQTSP